MSKFCYRALDTYIISEVELPELSPVKESDAFGRKPIRLRLGELPDELENATLKSSIHQTNGDSEHLVVLPGKVKMLTKHGDTIIIDPSSSSTEETGEEKQWRVFALGSGLTSIAYQRGLLAMHASTVRLPGSNCATAILGHTAAGKSTLCAALVERGAELLNDDLTPILLENGVFSSLPVSRAIKLHIDSLVAIGKSTVNLMPVRSSVKKYLFYPQNICSKPLPIGRFIIIGQARSCREEGKKTLEGAAAFAHISNCVHRRRAASAMGLRGRIFAQCMQIARSVPIETFYYKYDLDRLLQLAESVIADQCETQ